ncbi:MAG: bifunctional fucokinase/L-fucose-1-P-guanylyltransferase [Chloroflexi bacterium]|nr:bifunctional fucokinase/L-fucose-1-P-guanylyltransferase [Chloroflexota bacterium]
MQSREPAIQHLLSLPPQFVAQFEALEGRPRPEWFAASDPPGSKLGSGGGTAHLLAEAWQSTGGDASFNQWLQGHRKLIIHGGGQSRRLPAYAPVGKLFMPIPAFRWARGHRLDQTLLDLQAPEYRRILAHAPSGTVAMVASGDVFLRFARELPAFPKMDVLGLGMWVLPEQAKDFGVFFCPRQRPNELAFFLQKPPAARIRELSSEYLYLIDTGLWLLSERAVTVLLVQCGWNPAEERFAKGSPAPYELYGQFGLALGQAPSAPDAMVGSLTCAVVPLPRSEFYHLGTTRQMIEAVSHLQNLELDETKLGLMGARRHPDQYLQNSRFEIPLRQEENHTLWIENSVVPASWQLGHDHVLTGVPANQWDLQLEPGVCLDFVPIGVTGFCVRLYGINDSFAGAIGEVGTRWFDRPAPNWFLERAVSREEAGINLDADIQNAALFPMLEPDEMDPRFLEWMFAAKPVQSSEFARRWTQCRRLSASEIGGQANLHRLYEQRSRLRQGCLLPMLKNYRWSVFFKLDLEATAKLYAESPHPLPPGPGEVTDGGEPMWLVRDEMFRAAVLRHRGEQGWEQHEANAFARLSEMIVRDAQLSPVVPQRRLLEDQIVWGRSPVRLDLAGGWTDTPPYCLEHGGRVVNLAVDLNGQPPIQVFARLCERPELVMRSIDLGVEEKVRTYRELEAFAEPGSEFALAKAAFALAGFLPRFHAQGGFKTLQEQLQDFGGGIEISMLSAVPRGSGLGTSSILAATLLATLSDLCGLNWDRNILFTRTLALEQMLTTGGGWQDQAGGLFRGIKLLETSPGLAQKPTLRWLPDHLFDSEHANKTILLYYTGVTRLAKQILREIVRGIFLNSPSHLRIVDEIGANSEAAFNAIQKSDYAGLVESIRASWRLNQRLDSGTNPPAVQQILDCIQEYLAATKLLGAGGGGFLLLFAKDNEAGARLRQVLTEHPPNERARFVNFSLSDTGLQLTRS